MKSQRSTEKSWKPFLRTTWIWKMWDDLLSVWFSDSKSDWFCNGIFFSQDSLVVPAADSVDLTSALASGSLSKRPSERIINKKLQQQTEPPWGGGSVRDWSRTWVLHVWLWGQQWVLSLWSLICCLVQPILLEMSEEGLWFCLWWVACSSQSEPHIQLHISECTEMIHTTKTALLL